MQRILTLVAVLALLTGCANAIDGKATMAPTTDEWRNAVVDSVVEMGTYLGPISAAMAPTNYPALQTGCGKLRDYLDTMQHKVLPGPDANINSALQDGIDGYRSMAKQCMALTSTTTIAEILRLSATIDRADKRMKDALKLLGVKIPRR